MKILINGFGRIGRAVTRQLISSNIKADLFINSRTQDKRLLFYLLEYDSIYGRFKELEKVSIRSRIHFLNDDIVLQSQSKARISFDYLIDSSPKQSVDYSQLIKSGNFKKIILTHMSSVADFTFVFGVNEQNYDDKLHNIISMGICDVVAMAPILHFFDTNYKIQSGSILTIHPWLSYQNLLDNTSLGYMETLDYGLYRSAVGNLIPKTTTAVTANVVILPNLKGKIDGFTIRVPTSSVTSANISLVVKKQPKIKILMKELEKHSKRISILAMNNKPLVSQDFQKSTYACVIDTRFLKILPHNLIQLMLWYDNEWGYSARIVDFVKLNSKPYYKK